MYVHVGVRAAKQELGGVWTVVSRLLQAQTGFSVFSACTATGAPGSTAPDAQRSPNLPPRVLKQARPSSSTIAPQGARNRCDTNDWIIRATSTRTQRARVSSKTPHQRAPETDDNPRNNKGGCMVLSVLSSVYRAFSSRLAHLHTSALVRRRSRQNKAAPDSSIEGRRCGRRCRAVAAARVG